MYNTKLKKKIQHLFVMNKTAKIGQKLYKTAMKNFFNFF